MGKLDFLKVLLENLARLRLQDGKTFVQNGKRIGPGVGDSKNVIKGTTVSKNAEEALLQEKYEKSVLGNLTEDLSEREVEGIADRYTEKLVDDLFEGI